MNKKIQCKDIDDISILAFLNGMDREWATIFSGVQNSVLNAMPEGVSYRLALAKMKTLIRRGFVDGCPCGCRGDFFITDKGKDFLEMRQ